MESWGELVKIVAMPCLCCRLGPLAVVDQGWVGVLTHFGVYERQLPPGLYVYNCVTQDVRLVNMKMQTIEVPRQSAMTKDNLSVQVDAVAFITVIDASKASFRVEHYLFALKILAASTLLRVFGEYDLLDIFKNRAAVNRQVANTMQEKTGDWGVDIAGVEIRDITIPENMQRAMAQIAEANREAEAKVIVAGGQQRAAWILKDAADEMGKNPLSMQLQWFETLRSISAEKSSTVIVPDTIVGPLSDLAKACQSAASSSVAAAGSGSVAGTTESHAKISALTAAARQDVGSGAESLPTASLGGS